MKPLLSIAKFEFPSDNSDILVRFSGNSNGPYDGEFFRRSDDESFQKVELTRAVDGGDCALYKEHFEKFGHASVLPKAIKRYKKNECLAENPPTTRHIKDILSDSLELCEKATIKKLDPKYKRPPQSS